MIKASIAIEDFNNGVVGVVLETEEVKVAKADININWNEKEVEIVERETHNSSSGGGLAHATFAGVITTTQNVL